MRLRNREFQIRTKVSSAPAVAVAEKEMKVTDTDSNVDFNSGLNGTVGPVAVTMAAAVAVPEALNKGGAVTMKIDGLMFIMIMIVKLLKPAASTPLVLQSEMQLRLVQT